MFLQLSLSHRKTNTKVFTFEQHYPVAPYLIAITVGVLDRQASFTLILLNQVLKDAKNMFLIDFIQILE